MLCKKIFNKRRLFGEIVKSSKWIYTDVLVAKKRLRVASLYQDLWVASVELNFELAMGKWLQEDFIDLTKKLYRKRSQA